MQNKRFIRVLSIALALVCFLIATTNCTEATVHSKGGMIVTLEVSVPDILVTLSDYNETDIFRQAIENAKERKSGDFLTAFKDEFEKIDPNAKLSVIFSTVELKDKIQLSSTNVQVISVLREQVKLAIDKASNVLMARIEHFGVKPNIQKNYDENEIVIELPGVKEPERVRKHLQCSGNIEFWETFEAAELKNVMLDVNSYLREIKYVVAKQTAENQVAANNALSSIDSLAQALKALGKDGLDERARHHIAQRFTLQEQAEILQSGKYMTGWVYDTLKQIFAGGVQ